MAASSKASPASHQRLTFTLANMIGMRVQVRFGYTSLKKAVNTIRKASSQNSWSFMVFVNLQVQMMSGAVYEGILHGSGVGKESSLGVVLLMAYKRGNTDAKNPFVGPQAGASRDTYIEKLLIKDEDIVCQPFWIRRYQMQLFRKQMLLICPYSYLLLLLILFFIAGIRPMHWL